MQEGWDELAKSLQAKPAKVDRKVVAQIVRKINAS